MNRCFRAAALALLLIHAIAALGQAAVEAPIRFVAHSDRPILTLEREHGRIRGLVERPLLYIYGDGLVRVERPAYMVNPGLFEFRLGPGELEALLTSFDRDGVMTLDTAELRARRDAADQQRRAATGERLMTTDATVTRIRIDIASYARAGQPSAALGNILQYRDLQIDAIHFPQIEDLAALADAEKRLLALIDHPDMVAVGEVRR